MARSRVKGTNATTGTTYEIHASKAVVLATGGYTDSRNGLPGFSPSTDSMRVRAFTPVAPLDIQGDGLDMAEEVGAAVVSCGEVMLNLCSSPVPHCRPHYWRHGKPSVVNKEALRQ